MSSSKPTPSKPTPPTPQAGLIRSLVIGTVLLLTGLALGLKLRTTQPEVSRAAEAPHHAPAQPAGNLTHNGITESADARLDRDTANISTTNIESNREKNALNKNESLPEDSSLEQPDPAIIARRQEMQYLQEVLPDNSMIPHDKSPQQQDALWDEFTRYRALQQHIDAGDATDAEKEEYFGIRMAKYEEEKSLIELCRNVAANTLANADAKQALLCQHMTESSAERLQVIEDSIAKLEQDLWATAHGE